jgi:hypothetical protein
MMPADAPRRMGGRAVHTSAWGRKILRTSL